MSVHIGQLYGNQREMGNFLIMWLESFTEHVQKINKIQEKEILIIEDSETTCIKISNILKQIGFSKITIAHTAASGLYSFEQLIKTGKIPLVFLNFLPETNVLTIVNMLHQIYLNTKIILISSFDNNSKNVRDMIANGIYWNLKIPISVEELCKIFKNIEEEEIMLQGSKIEEQIVDYISKHEIIDIEELKHQAVDTKKILDVIKSLEQKSILKKENEITKLQCSNCINTDIRFSFCCPACRKGKFKKCVLIEHYACGNVTLEQNFVEDICPTCEKSIKSIGVDYRKIQNLFICENCNERFPEPLLINYCVSCKTKFILENARWQASRVYRVISHNSLTNVIS